MTSSAGEFLKEEYRDRRFMAIDTAREDRQMEETKEAAQPTVAQRLNYQQAKNAYAGTHMRGGVWPSKRKAAPVDPHRALTKREKRALRQEAKEAGKPQPITLPIQTRRMAPVCHPQVVDQFLTQDNARNAETPEDLSRILGRGYGYVTGAAMEQQARRVGRYFTRHPERRVPRHIRERSVLASAILLSVVGRFPEQATDEMKNGAAALRGMFEGAAA